MKAIIVPLALTIVALAGALAEGLWPGIPAALIQLNGILLILSVIAIGFLAVRPTLRRRFSDAAGPTSAPRSAGS